MVAQAAAISTQLQAIRTRFLTLLDDRLDMLEYYRANVGRTDDDQAALIGIRDIAHKISGTAGTLGFAELGKEAANVENAIIGELTGPALVSASPALCNQIDDFLELAAQVAIALDGEQDESAPTH